MIPIYDSRDIHWLQVYYKKYEETIARNFICRLGDKRTANENVFYFILLRNKRRNSRSRNICTTVFVIHRDLLASRDGLFFRFHRILPAACVRKPLLYFVPLESPVRLCLANKVRKWNSWRQIFCSKSALYTIIRHSFHLLLSTSNELIYASIYTSIEFIDRLCGNKTMMTIWNYLSIRNTNSNWEDFDLSVASVIMWAYICDYIS